MNSLKVKVSVMSSSCDPMDCRLPGSSVHGTLQAKVLEWVAIPFSRINSLHVRKSGIFMKNKYIFQNKQTKNSEEWPCPTFQFSIISRKILKELITIFVSKEPEFGNQKIGEGRKAYFQFEFCALYINYHLKHVSDLIKPLSFLLAERCLK